MLLADRALYKFFAILIASSGALAVFRMRASLSLPGCPIPHELSGPAALLKKVVLGEDVL